MNARRMWEVTRKDLEEIRKSRAILVSMLAVPIVLVVEGLFLAAIAPPGTEQASVNLFLSFFLVIPALVSVMIASTGIVQEKNNRSLEPLLATPISDRELLWGKALAPLIPALAATFASYTAFFVGVDALSLGDGSGVVLPSTLALYLMFGLAPLLALLGTFTALWISSRMPDVRSAQQFSTMIVMPAFLVAVLAVVVAGGNWTVLVALGLVFLFAVWAVSRRVVDRFERSTILVSWR